MQSQGYILGYRFIQTQYEIKSICHARCYANTVWGQCCLNTVQSLIQKPVSEWILMMRSLNWILAKSLMSVQQEWEIWLQSNEGISLIKIHSHSLLLLHKIQVVGKYGYFTSKTGSSHTSQDNRDRLDFSVVQRKCKVKVIYHIKGSYK